MSNVISY